MIGTKQHPLDQALFRELCEQVKGPNIQTDKPVLGRTVRRWKATADFEYMGRFTMSEWREFHKRGAK